MQKRLAIFLTILFLVSLHSCEKTKTRALSEPQSSKSEAIMAVNEENIKNQPKVTFIELGSVNCIPCKKMQPVMKAIEVKYPEQVKIIFYDVWTKEGKPYAQQYKIRVIPTQVFLDSAGNEFFRHEGFYPQEEIEKILQQKGVQ